MNILQVIAERFNTFTAEKITSLSRIVNINSKDHILREYPINVKNSSTQSEEVRVGVGVGVGVGVVGGLGIACCFGVEITMTNAAVLYFTSKFEDLSIEKAAAIASIFGWMNLFARGLGGFCSDMMNATRGMRGRLIFQAVSLALQGMCIVVFALADSLGGAITVMIVFSLFVQTSEGAIYAVIPYVKPSVTGSVVGLVGAGGSLGGVMFSLIFRYSASYQKGFITMGVIAAASSLLTPFIQIPGQTSLLCRPCGRFTDLLEQRSLHSVAQASVQSTRSARFGAPTTTVTVAANGRTT